MTKAEMLALAERCEQAAGPDRELDEAIASSVPNAIAWLASHKAGFPCWPGSGWGRYTGSLDAAVTLASGLEKFGGTAGMIREAMDRLAVKFALHMRRWPAGEDYASCLVRFVTAASLRARAATMDVPVVTLDQLGKGDL